MVVPVTLHVGTEKTGSTSIQNHLDRHRETLLAQGILFPASVFTRKVEAQPERTSGHLQLIRDLANNDIGAFEDEIRTTPHERLLFSAENILHFPDDAPLKKLKAVLKDAPITIIAVLRRQDHWLRSYYAECVQGGWNREARSFDRFAQDILASGLLDYTACLARMQRIFEPAEIKVINYDIARKDDGLISAFIQAAQLPLDAPDLKEAHHSHVSKYSAEGLEAHRRLNALGRALWSKHMHSWTQDMLRITRAGPQENLLKPAPERATRNEIMAQLDQSNTVLTVRHLDNVSFEIGTAWRMTSPPSPDEDGVNQFVTEGLKSLMQVHADAPSFLKKKSDIPPPLTIGTQEAAWLFDLFAKPCTVLGLQTDALSYLTALHKNCHATFVDPDATRALLFQLDFDKLDLPATPLFRHCPPPLSPWDLPGLMAPDIVLLSQNAARDGMFQCIKHAKKSTRVVVYPDASSTGPDIDRPCDFQVGGLQIFDLAARP